MKKKVFIPSQPESFGTENLEYMIINSAVTNGQYVVHNQLLFEVETNNVILEVVSENNGQLESLLVTTEQVVQPGDLAAVINTESSPSFAFLLKIFLFNRVFMSGFIIGSIITSLLWWLF